MLWYKKLIENTQNTMIEVEIITLSTSVYIVPSYVKPVSKNFVIVFDLSLKYSEY